eukprot:5028837-Amphidinium_carterae.4
MKLNKTKCVVVANTAACRLECQRVWNRMGVDVAFTTRDLGVDVQWGPWRNPVQQSRIKSFTAAMTRVRMLNLPLRFKIGMIRALYPLVIYGSEVSGLAATSMRKVRVSARSVLGRGAQLRRAAELELLKGGLMILAKRTHKSPLSHWALTFTPSERGTELCSGFRCGHLHQRTGRRHH